MLARFKNLGYNRPAPPKNGVGCESPVHGGDEPHNLTDAAFSFLAPFMAARMGGSKDPAGLASAVPSLSHPSVAAARGEMRAVVVHQARLEANMPTTAISSHVSVIDGQPTTTTQDIADVYGKRHDDVLRLVRKRIEDAGEWGVRNFTETVTDRPNPSGGAPIQSPVIRMTKKGFHFVVGKFTGSKAVKHQIAFADEFERMEDELANKRLTTEAPYTALPGQKLSAENAAEIRLMVQHAAERLPKDKQGAFCIKAWSKLKSHFGVGYRDIPDAQFSDAVSIIGRHIIECVGTTAGPEGTWLLTLDNDGRKTMTQLAWDDCIIKWSDLPKLIAASDNVLPNELVANIAAVASSRLAGAYTR